MNRAPVSKALVDLRVAIKNETNGKSDFRIVIKVIQRLITVSLKI